MSPIPLEYMLYDKPDFEEVLIWPSLNSMILWNALDENLDFGVAEFTVERLPLKTSIREQVLVSRCEVSHGPLVSQESGETPR